MATLLSGTWTSASTNRKKEKKEGRLVVYPSESVSR